MTDRYVALYEWATAAVRNDPDATVDILIQKIADAEAAYASMLTQQEAEDMGRHAATQAVENYLKAGYICDICGNRILKEAHGGDHPSTGDHDSGEHVIHAYRSAKR